MMNCTRTHKQTKADVDYIECHGTGTALGDPIEVDALRTVFTPRAADRPLVLGAVMIAIETAFEREFGSPPTRSEKKATLDALYQSEELAEVE